MKLVDRTGQKFGRLTVLYRAGNLSGRPAWLCRCDCGEAKVVRVTQLVSGSTRSCGCLATESRTKHGLTDSFEHRVWRGIRTRCNNPNATYYENYGGRGIS